MKLIYLASPYSHPDEAIRKMRYMQALRATIMLFQENHYVYSPIAYTHPIATLGEFHLGFDVWGDFDFHILSKCDELWILPLAGWRDSIGMKSEIYEAIALGIPIKLVPAHIVDALLNEEGKLA